MLYIEIDTRSAVPIYAQIMDRIRRLAGAGELPPDTPLPSVRQLAADLDINPNTVAKAYNLLEREGIVQAARRRGTVIAPSAPDIAQQTVDRRLEEAIDRMVLEAASLGVGVPQLLAALERRASNHDGHSGAQSKQGGSK